VANVYKIFYFQNANDFFFFLNAFFASIVLAERMSAEDQEKLYLVLFNP